MMAGNKRKQNKVKWEVSCSNRFNANVDGADRAMEGQELESSHSLLNLLAFGTITIEPMESSHEGSMLDETSYLRKKRHHLTECINEKIQGRFGI